jgi:hypothetical protein
METLKKYSHLISAAAVLIIILASWLLTPSYNVLVRDSGSQWYHAKALFLVANRMVCMKDDTLYSSRDGALAHESESAWPAIVSLGDIRIIEIIPGEEKEPESGDLPIRHYGIFKINASGHIGYLYLSDNNGTVYGTIRFPEWGLGSYEKLKDIRVGKDSITFTRSVTTAQEMRKTGAPVYFTQKYQGTYSLGGKFIKGQYRTSQGKFLWEAQRVK